MYVKMVVENCEFIEFCFCILSNNSCVTTFDPATTLQQPALKHEREMIMLVLTVPYLCI